MFIVKHKITIGSNTLKLDKQTRLTDLRVHAGLDVPVNSCRITLSPVKDLSIKTADSVKVELGYGDTLSLVFTGKVSTAEWGFERVVVHAAGSFQPLVSARYNLVYEKPKAGDIVSDVAGRVKVGIGKVENGLEFAAYALGDNGTAYQHLWELARHCGFDLYANTEDKLVFAKYQAATTHNFEYGKEVLSFALDEQAVMVEGVTVFGESPASHGQGADASTWLTKKDVKGTAGKSSGVVWRLPVGAVRTQDLAGKVAEGAWTAVSPAKFATLKVLGAPAVKLGDAVKLAKLPTSSHNGTYKVTAVTHTLSTQRGYMTTVGLQGESS